MDSQKSRIGGGRVMDVRISLYGCDDETHIDTDVSAEEYDFLRKLKRLSKDNSKYACQPILDVKKRRRQND